MSIRDLFGSALRLRKSFSRGSWFDTAQFERDDNPMWVYDAQTLAFLAVNAAALRHYGYTRKTFLAMTIADIRPRQDVAALERNLSAHTSGLEHSEGWRHMKSDGTIIYVDITSVSVTFEGRVARQVLVKDVTARRIAAERTKFLAEHDPLTGLFNRTEMRRFLEVSLDRRGDRFVTVLFVDLDGFKSINDRFGHPAGDDVLVGVAQRISGVLRPSEIAARLGGDEFVVVMPDAGSRAEALALGQRIRAALLLPFIIQERPHIISASVGISTSPDDGNDADSLLHAADSAMYERKKARHAV